MTKPSQTLIDKIKSCTRCNLCLNQPPLIDKSQKGDIFWVGLSAVKVDSDAHNIPLSGKTNTGKLISQVEESNAHSRFYKTNAVKCLPLNANKIRYPNRSEMKSCQSHLQEEIATLKPKLVFLLGKQVAEFIKGEAIAFSDDFNYSTFKKDGVTYVPVHHPSFILVYRRKLVSKYTESLSRIIQNHSGTYKHLSREVLNKQSVFTSSIQGLLPPLQRPFISAPL
jgi:DNA polymerase